MSYLSGCDDYKISILGLEERSDIIINEDIIRDICIKEKEDDKKSVFSSYCDDTKNIELVLIYKEESGCDWKISDQNPKKGKYGSAYSTCCNENFKDCDYVLKIDKYEYNCREVYIHLMLSKLGIAPKLYEIWKVKSGKSLENIGTIFIMKKLDQNLYDILMNDNVDINRIYKDLMDKLDILYNNKIKHNDLHLHNIMLDSNGILYLIDFGMSERFGSYIRKENYLRNQLNILINQLRGESLIEKDNGVQDSNNNFLKFLNKLSLYSDEDIFQGKRTIKIGSAKERSMGSLKSILKNKYEEDKERQKRETLEIIRQFEEEEKMKKDIEEEKIKVIPYDILLELIKEELKSNSFLVDISDNVSMTLRKFSEKINLLNKEEKKEIKEYLSNVKKRKIIF